MDPAGNKFLTATRKRGGRRPVGLWRPAPFSRSPSFQRAPGMAAKADCAGMATYVGCMARPLKNRPCREVQMYVAISRAQTFESPTMNFIQAYSSGPWQVSSSLDQTTASWPARLNMAANVPPPIPPA